MKKSASLLKIDHTKDYVVFIDEDTLTQEELLDIAEEGELLGETEE